MIRFWHIKVCLHVFCRFLCELIWVAEWRMYIYVGNLTISGSDNVMSPGPRQAVIGTNAGVLLIGPLGTNFSEILSEILILSFTKVRLKVSSAK